MPSCSSLNPYSYADSSQRLGIILCSALWRLCRARHKRHAFCSHLAMRGAAPKAIQELAGHSTLTMTLRYMHLAPSALREAIELLNFGQRMGSTAAVTP